MHEVTIVQGLLKMLQEETEKHGASHVTRVHLRIGELSAIVPDALSFAFEVVSEGSVADGAELEIEVVPARGRCDQCNKTFTLDGMMFFCPECGAMASEIISGKELELAEFDAE